MTMQTFNEEQRQWDVVERVTLGKIDEMQKSPDWGEAWAKLAELVIKDIRQYVYKGEEG